MQKILAGHRCVVCIKVASEEQPLQLDRNAAQPRLGNASKHLILEPNCHGRPLVVESIWTFKVGTQACVPPVKLASCRPEEEHIEGQLQVR